MSLPEIGLFGILILVFSAPFLSKSIEHNLEIFLFIMGCLAVSVSSAWDRHLIYEALKEPLPISIVVLSAGFLFKCGRKKMEQGIQFLLTVIPLPIFIFLLIVGLGVLSSVITAIIAALILVEVISILKLDRTSEINITIIACFSIGLGAALTPVGEPLSTIVVAKLHESFWYLLKNFGFLILPPIFVLGLVAPWFHKPSSDGLEATSWKEEDSTSSVMMRAFKVYLFVMALLFLGAGFKPVIDTYLSIISSGVLFWLNMVSAILDNATLAAAEISPTLTDVQIKSILMGLLISGGMLIPGNIPNIIAAGKLKIKSREWATLGIPLGLVMMVIYFLILHII